MTGAPADLVCEKVIAASNELPPPQNLRYVISLIHSVLSRNSAVQLELGKLRKCNIAKLLDSSHVEIQLKHGVAVVISVNEGYPDSPTGVSVDRIIGSASETSDALVKSLNSRCMSSIDQAYRAVMAALTIVQSAETSENAAGFSNM